MKSYFKKIYNTYKVSKRILKDSDYDAMFQLGKKYKNSSYHIEGKNKTRLETEKVPKRFDIINFLLNTFKTDTIYLEIGVRYPEHNFNKINARKKYSVDPGLENKTNPVDFKLTSDDFFNKLNNDEILSRDIKFDVIFIDGLHLAEQVEKDIENALKFIKDDGYIVLHDCNPPTFFHASELYKYRLSPALGHWNGTTWKAFYKSRLRADLYSCCIDTDWGIGVISKTKKIGQNTIVENPFFEYSVLDCKRQDSLGLLSFEDFKNLNAFKI